MLIPKVLFQTANKQLPSSTLAALKKQLTPEWTYEFYSDDDIVSFFVKNPQDDFPDIIPRWNALKRGAHKADYFRYYYLYVNGGMFLDSDAMLYTALEPLLEGYEFVSVKSTHMPNCIFQGILASVKGSPIIKEALTRAYNTPTAALEGDYHTFCYQMYDILQVWTPSHKIKLYEEVKKADHDLIVEGEKLLFKHYWKTKVIPSYTEEFTEIYDSNFWIRGSGTGSYVENTLPYNQFMIDFIEKNKIQTVTDIGCGDWQSSHLIYNNTNVDYLGIDCVKKVIDANRLAHPTYKFENFDILSNLDKIRDSEVYVIKDVLQHLRLEDVYVLLDALTKKCFKYIIITNNANQTYDDLEVRSIGVGRGFHSKYLPLKKYKAIPLLDYYGAENKHVCMIQSQSTNWNEYKKEELHSFPYTVLSTYSVPNLVRVGPKCDGGYVIVDGFEYDLFLSCGISDDLRFEDGFLNKYKIPCIAFDGTISRVPAHKNLLHWEKKNIGPVNTLTTTNMKEYMGNSKNIFLKMDIEGSEFDWLNSMSTEDLSLFAQIVMEIHWPFDVYRAKMLEKLNETHYLVHLHGNNYCDRDIPTGLPSGRTYDGTVTIKCQGLQEIRLPEVFEATYIRKGQTYYKKEIQFPTPLDSPNNPLAEDISFSIPLPV